MSKGRIIVKLHMEGKHLGKGSRSITVALAPAQAGELAAKALMLALSPDRALEAASPELRPFVKAGQDLSDKYEHAIELLRAALGRFEATERTPASDTLTFKIMEFLENN